MGSFKRGTFVVFFLSDASLPIRLYTFSIRRTFLLVGSLKEVKLMVQKAVFHLRGAKERRCFESIRFGGGI